MRLHLQLAGLLLLAWTCAPVKYTEDWKSLDSRPLPGWYDEAKVGIFIHWGVFSVPAYASEWIWWYWRGSKNKMVVDFMAKNYRPDFTYADFAPMFTAEFYDADKWAGVLQKSGAQYVVLTSKHHDGYCNWPTKGSFNWNSMAVGPHRDLVGELATAIRNKTKLHFGLYHSMFEWFHPLYLQDKANNYTTSNFVDWKTMPELKEIVNQYKPELIWSDGSWEVNDTYWKSTKFLAWLYNESPVKDVVVVNDRWGSNTLCHHGGYYTCNDRYNPGKLVNHKWENAMTIDKGSWGYRRNADIADYLTMTELITTLIETVSCGGNILINIGPTHDGRISPTFEEKLLDLGAWLKVNGEAIYKSKPWTHQNDSITTGVWYTSKVEQNCLKLGDIDEFCTSSTVVYALLTSWPEGPLLQLGSVLANPLTKIHLVGYEGSPLSWKHDDANGNGGLLVEWPVVPYNKMPCRWAWTLRITNLI